MNSDSTALEMRINQAYKGVGVLLFSRGISALYALFCALRVRHGVGEVIVPAICCESVALAAQYAGHRAVIADVDPETLCMSPDHARTLLKPATRAVVLVYVFGILVDPVPWRELAQSQGICLVEDICQAVGGVFDGGSLAGSVGDVTLLSFAEDKIIAGDGGALVIRNPALLEDVAKSAYALPEGASGRRLELMSLSWRNFCHSLYDLHRAEPDYGPATHFAQMEPLFQDIFIRQGTPSAPTVQRGLDDLDNERFRRQERVAVLREGIASISGMRCFHSVGTPMWWRFPFLAPGLQETVALTLQLRRAGLPVSNHYFPLNLLFGGGALPVASDLGLRLLNLWVDDAMDDERLRLAISIIADFFSDSAGGARR